MSRQEYLESSPKEIKTLFDIHARYNNFEFKHDNNENLDTRVYLIDELPFSI